MFDITIVGAGPAGLMLARMLASKYKILVIEKRDFSEDGYENKRNKCCGGLLSPDAQHVIATLGLGIPKEILVDPQLFTVRTLDLKNNLQQYYQRFYFNMDRENFDLWLLSLVPHNVDFRFNSILKEFTEMKDGYLVKYTSNKTVFEVETRVLIGADGANSIVRKLGFANREMPKKYIAIQEWYEETEPMPYYTAIFDEGITDFYSWIIPKSGYLLLGAALEIDGQANMKFDLLKRKLEERGFKFGRRVKREGAFIFRPLSVKQIVTGKDNLILLGEAAGAISPSSAEGFSYAIKSAIYAAESLSEGIDGFYKRYDKKMKKLKMNIILKNLKSPGMYNPLIRKGVIKSGLKSMKIINDQSDE